MCVAALWGRLRGKNNRSSRTKKKLDLLTLHAFFFLAFVLSRCDCCPDECLCSTQTVKCQNRDLRAIPQPLPANTRQLFVTGNRIGSVGAESFPSRLDQLTELHLNGNEMEEVEPDAFRNLPNLERLDLSDNTILNISAAAFPDDNKVTVLNLSSSFHVNASTSTILLSALRKGNFVRLAHLDLSHNHLLVLPDGAFAGLPALADLSLRNASLVSLQNGTGLQVPPLRELDLRDNSLRELPNGTLADLGLNAAAEADDGLRVRLAGNPWRCDCFIEDLAAWLKTTAADQAVDVVDAQNLSCAEPEALRGRPLLQLEPQQLECSYSGDMKGVLETSYVFLGLVLALIGVIFLLVLYLNRKGIKRWIYNIRDACRDHMEGYHYRYEINTDPRMANLSINSDV